MPTGRIALVKALIVVFGGVFWPSFALVAAHEYSHRRETGKKVTWSEILFLGILLLPGWIFLAAWRAMTWFAFWAWDLFDKPIRKR